MKHKAIEADGTIGIATNEGTTEIHPKEAVELMRTLAVACGRAIRNDMAKGDKYDHEDLLIGMIEAKVALSTSINGVQAMLKLKAEV